MKNNSKRAGVVTKKEYIAYCLFFLGQNLLWGYAGYIETFLTDIGIAAATAGVILIVPKIWDALNDVLFGYIADRHMFKNGQKFVPWIKIGVSAVGITLVALFAIPATNTISTTMKIVWFLIAYILFDAAYTVLDTPAFAVTTVMTPDIDERTWVIAGGKLWAMVGGVVATVLIPLIRPRLGWFTACVVFIVVSVILMVPLCFSAKERHSEATKAAENPTFKEMLKYLKNNRYLIIVLVAMFLLGVSSVEQKMAIYMARICLGSESKATLISAGVAVAVIAVSVAIPKLSKKWDKFDILCVGIAFAIVMDVVTYFVGYSNIIVALVMIMLKCTGLGFWQVIIYMLIADTVEYGMYKSGSRAAGITFSLQCFVSKFRTALIGSIILFSLSAVGYVEGENAIQPAGVDQGIWMLFNLLPAAGFLIALIVLVLMYKLKSKDVQIMSKFNNGEITKEEAEGALAASYGKAHD